MPRVLHLLGALAVAATLLAAPAMAVPAPQIELSPPFGPGGTVHDLAFTPDGGRVVYTASPESGAPRSLYVAPADGSGPAVQLAPGPVIGSPIVTPDGTRVVYLGQELQPGITEAYVASLDGSEHFRASAPLGAGRKVSQGLAVSPDGTWLAYRADKNTIDEYELFVTVISGGGPGPTLTVNDPLIAGGRISPNSIEFSPDGDHLVWRAEQDAVGRTELFAVTVGNWNPVRLHPPYPGTRSVTAYRITPDSSRVVYRADQAEAGVYELYSVSITGGLTPRISDNLGGPSDVEHSFELTPDGERVVYQADRELDAHNRVFVTPADGSGAPVPLTPPPVAGRVIFGNAVISPDGSRVAYAADHTVDNVIDLYTVPLDDSTDPVRITPSVATAFSPAFSPDGATIVYASRQDDPAVMELYAAPADGSGPVRKLNPPLPHGRVASSGPVAFTADGAHAVFEAGWDDASFFGDLYLAPLTGPGVAVQLNDGHHREGLLREWVLHRASGRVAFTHDRDVADQFELYTARVDEAVARLGSMDGAARFVALPPERLFDTRPEHPGNGPKGFVGAGQTIDVQITGVAGVPADAVAVVMNLTATEAAAAGFVTAFGAGQGLPLASNLNLTRPNQTRPNLVTVPVGDGGRVSLHTQSGTHLLADVAGYYVDADIARSDGRIVPLTPSRIFDSRPGETPPGPKGLIPAGGSVDIDVLGVGGVPATGVAAVVVNVTATDAQDAGFVTAWSTGDPMPLASVGNLNGPGDTAPNLAIVPVGAGGRISLFSQSGAHLLADVTAFVTDGAAVVDDAGLFVPLAPTRVFDTRPGEPAAGPKGSVGAGATIAPSFTGVAGIPAHAGSVAVNLTATEAATGFVTAWPEGLAQPLASTLNLNGPLDTRPNAAILPIGTSGRIAHYTQSGAHLLADTTGYFLG